MPKNIQAFKELIESFYLRNSSKAAAEKELKKHSLDLLKSIPEMTPVLKSMPEYGALAFYGAFQIKKNVVDRLRKANSSGDVAIAALREEKALRVSEIARDAWTFLLENDKDVLWQIIKLNVEITDRRKSNEQNDDEVGVEPEEEFEQEEGDEE